MTITTNRKFQGEFDVSKESARKQFRVSSGAMRVTDPCYSVDTWCSGQVPALDGVWTAHVGYGVDLEELALARKFHAEQLQRAQDDAENVCQRLKLDPGDAEEIKEAYLRIWRRNEPTEESCQRVQYLHVAHESLALDPTEPIDFASYELVEGVDVGVDSGQAGFFDLASYTNAVKDRSDTSQDGPAFEKFYREICDQTLSDDQFGGVDFGAVSSSGYGDGRYPCYVRRNDRGEVIAAFIAFIYTGEDEEEDEE